MPEASSKDVSQGLAGWLGTKHLQTRVAQATQVPLALLPAQATPRLHFHPEPVLLPGLTPATDRLTWPPGTAHRLRCLLLSATRGLADFAKGCCQLGMEPRLPWTMSTTLSCHLPRCRSLPPMLPDAPGHPHTQRGCQLRSLLVPIGTGLGPSWRS